MRLPLTSLGAGLAAMLLAASQASAQEPVPFVVQADFSNASDADVARMELERELNEFRDEVRRLERRRRPTFGRFVVLPASGLRRNPRAAWKADTIAMVMGRLYRGAASPVMRPSATLYIGPLRVQPMLPRRANSFDRLQGLVALRGGRETDVGTYANYIGYAVLLRTWAQQPARAAAIARVLERRIEDDFRGPNGPSTCLDDLRSAVKIIGRLARENRAPQAANMPDVMALDCDPRG